METEGSLPHSQVPAIKYRYLINCRKIKKIIEESLCDN
jgi:hypothetical protein